MDVTRILSCLNEVGRLGSEGFKGSWCISSVTKNSTDLINSFPDVDRSSEEKDCRESEITQFEDFIAKFYDANDAVRQDERLHCAVNALYLLHCTLILNDEELKRKWENAKQTENLDEIKMSKLQRCRNTPEAPSDLISLQHLQIIEGCVKYILYTLYFASLDEDAILYFKMRIIQEKLVFGENLVEVPSSSHHIVLKLTLKYLLPLFKHKSIGTQLQRDFMAEILCGLLQLSFSPAEMSHYPEDIPDFRQELEVLFNISFPSHILKGILLLKGVSTQKKGKSWLRNVCQSIYARRFLLKEDGVRLSMEVALSIGGFSDWRKKEAVAVLISLAKVPNDIEFFERLCPQILKLLKEMEKQGDAFQILAFVLCHLAKRSPKLAQMHLFKPFLEPLLSITSKGQTDSLTGEDLIQTVSRLYKLYVEVLPPSGELKPFLKPVLCSLASIAALPPTCHVKTEAQLILVRYLSQLETEEIISTLLIIAGLEMSENTPPVNAELKLVSRLNEIEIETQSNDSDWIEIDERRIRSLIEIMDKLKLSSVVIEFLRKLTVYVDFTVLNNIEISDNQLFTNADFIDINFERIRRLTLVVGLLNSISDSENLASDLFSDISSALPIIESLLQKHRQQCSDLGLAQTRDSFIMNCVMLVSCYTSDRALNGKMTSSDWRGLRGIVPTLKELKNNTQNAALIDLVERLLHLVLTHGVVGVDCKDSNSPQPTEGKQSAAKQLPITKPLLTSITHTTKNLTSTTTPTSTSSTTNAYTSASTQKSPSNTHTKRLPPYQEAVVDACSPHLPVRGHALISLTKLVESKDEVAMRNSDKILSMFEHHLRDEDSYIYLASIEGLVALSTSHSQKVVTILMEEFARGNQTIETRLKLVEILTKTTNRLGPILPKYKNLFLNCLLNGVRDEDSLIRASCLSNLGEVCKELRFSVESVLHEIFSLVENVIENDKSPEVKRAAVVFVTLLLQGLGKDSLKVLQTVILDIYRNLKRLILTHNDPVLVMQAELAMEEINIITKEFLIPKMKLRKKIFVADIPSHPL